MNHGYKQQASAWIVAIVLSAGIYVGFGAALKKTPYTQSLAAKTVGEAVHAPAGHEPAHGDAQHGETKAEAHHGDPHAAPAAHGHDAKPAAAHEEENKQNGHPAPANAHGDAHAPAGEHAPAADHAPAAGHAPAGDHHSNVKAEPAGTHWAYTGPTGPSSWGDLAPEFAKCKIGNMQSPIDIVGAKYSEKLPNINFHYQEGRVAIFNNGHTLQSSYEPGSYIEIAGHRYDLIQFHLHTPSEHTVEGHSYAMELHLVHKDKDSKLAVIGVMIEEGEPNAAIGKFWSNLPRQVGTPNPDVRMNIAEVLPKNRDYFRYEGSLTTPPCSEGVAWHVLTNPINISAKQVDEFIAVVGNNARPVQKMFSRQSMVSSLAH